MKSIYCIMWEYGKHQDYIITSERCFNDVINKMSTEFKITRKEKENENKICYYFEDYYGDTILLGVESKQKEKNK